MRFQFPCRFGAAFPPLQVLGFLIGLAVSVCGHVESAG